MDTEVIDIEGQEIAISDGKGEGTPVIFIHGNSLSKETFSKQFDSELGHKHRLIAFDLPGHGNSSRPVNPEEAYSIPGYIAVLKGVIGTLGLSEYFLVGHSMGGHVVLEGTAGLAQGLKGLMIFGTPPLGSPPDMANAYQPNQAMGLAFQGELKEAEARTLANEFVLGDALEEIVQSILNTDPNARTYMAASIGQGKMKDEIEIVRNLPVPLAILHAEQDALVNLDYIRGLDIPTLWKGEVRIIKDSGHSPQLENPDEFNSVLNSFLEETRD